MKLTGPQKLGLSGLGCILGFAFLGYVLMDKLLEIGIKDQTCLRKRNQIYPIYMKMPIPFEFKVFFFNISNPFEVMTGAKPILKEVGPYCYYKYHQKVEVVDSNVDDSITYNGYDLYSYNTSCSGENLSDHDYVTILHPLIVGMVNQVTKDSPPLLNIVNKAINAIFGNPETMYITAKVKDVLFDGMRINCNVKEFSAKAVCTQMKQLIPGLKMAPEKNVYLFSLLGVRNGTEQNRIKVLKGIKKSRDTGRVVEVDGKKELTLWSTPFCNRFKGTDGWVFPPLQPKEDGLWTYSADLCRNVEAYFVEDVKYKGLNVRKYYADIGDSEHNARDKCYCSKTCFKKGTYDLSKCMGVPIVATLPHFLLTDEIFKTKVSGMEPNLEKHIITIYFEPMTGTPLEGRKRLQFNLETQASEKVTLLKTVPETLHPLFWIEEGVELKGDLLNKILNIFLFLKILDSVKFIGMAVGAGICGYGAYLYIKEQNGSKVTPVQNDEENEEKDSENQSEKNSGKHPSEKYVTNGVKHVMSGNELSKY